MSTAKSINSVEKYEEEMKAYALLRASTGRLCRAVSKRMQADEPTPEERIELLEAYNSAYDFLDNVVHLEE